jgi:AbrB family looped-hinge helix DNA binding protein
MAQTLTAKVDAKGRVSIPQKIRDELEIGPGDTLFVEYDAEQKVLRYAKADNPFDILLTYAEEEERAGRTRSLRVFAAENNIALGDD